MAKPSPKQNQLNCCLAKLNIEKIQRCYRELSLCYSYWPRVHKLLKKETNAR